MYRDVDKRRDLVKDLAVEIFEEIDLIAFILDESGNIISANKFALNFVKYSIDELIYKNWFDIFTPELALERRQKILNKCLNGYRFRNRRIRILLPTNEVRVVEFNYEVIYKDIGRFIFVYGKDVTELTIAEDKFEHLSDSIPGVIFIKELSKQNCQIIKWLYLNKYVSILCGYDREDIINDKIKVSDLLHPDDINILRKISNDIRTNKRTTVFYRILHKNGSIRYIQETCLVISEKPDSYIIEGFIYDITDVREVQKALTVSETKFQALVENTPVGVYIVEDEVYVYVNRAFAKIYGYSSPDEICGKLTLKDMVHPDSLDLVRQNINKRLRGIDEYVNYEHLGLTKQGKAITVEIYGSRMFHDGKVIVVGTIVDVTEKVKWRRFLEVRHEMFVKLSSSRRISDVPSILSDYLKILCEMDCVGLYLRSGSKFILKYQCNFDNVCNSTIFKEISKDSYLSFIYNQIVYNRKAYYSRIEKFPFLGIYYDSVKYFGFIPIIHGSDNRVIAILFVGSRTSLDVDKYLENVLEIIGTQLSDTIIRLMNEYIIRRTLKNLRKALADKDILIREIHHRVKNNLQVMLSMFGMQKKYVNNEQVKELFDEVRHRIYTMSIIHEILYQSREFSSLTLKNYITNLIQNLITLYSSKYDNVQFDIEADIGDCSDFPVHYVTPIGLIINEVVSNIFKHAFKDHVADKKQVKFIFVCGVDNLFKFSIIDNGKGLSPDFDIEKSQNFGLYLIKILSKSISAQFSYSRDEQTHGTKFEFQLIKTNNKNKQNSNTRRI